MKVAMLLSKDKALGVRWGNLNGSLTKAGLSGRCFLESGRKSSFYKNHLPPNLLPESNYPFWPLYFLKELWPFINRGRQLSPGTGSERIWKAVTGIPDPIAVKIFLIVIRYQWAIIASVSYLVAICIFLRRICHQRAVIFVILFAVIIPIRVAGVAKSVTVGHIHLIGVRDRFTVVAVISNTVSICVVLTFAVIPVIYSRTIVTCVPTTISVRIFLRRIRFINTIITRISPAVLVSILRRVSGDVRAPVASVSEPVIIRIGLVAIRYFGAVVKIVQMAILVVVHASNFASNPDRSKGFMDVTDIRQCKPVCCGDGTCSNGIAALITKRHRLRRGYKNAGLPYGLKFCIQELRV